MTDVITFPTKPTPTTSPTVAMKPAAARRTKVRTIDAFPPGGHTKVEVKGIKHPAVRDAVNRLGDWLIHLDTERDTLADDQAQRLVHHLEAAETTLAGIVFLLGPSKPLGGKRA